MSGKIPDGWIRQGDGSFSPPKASVARELPHRDEFEQPKKSKHKSKSYNEGFVKSFFESRGIPEPQFEYPFAHTIGRKWRFDICWTSSPFTIYKLAVEVDGGIWIAGGHNRGAQMKKDWEKANAAAIMGWRILRCEPKDLCTIAFAEIIKSALEASA